MAGISGLALKRPSVIPGFGLALRVTTSAGTGGGTTLTLSVSRSTLPSLLAVKMTW